MFLGRRPGVGFLSEWREATKLRVLLLVAINAMVAAIPLSGLRVVNRRRRAERGAPHTMPSLSHGVPRYRGAASVTRGAVRCSAWLGPADIQKVFNLEVLRNELPHRFSGYTKL